MNLNMSIIFDELQTLYSSVFPHFHEGSNSVFLTSPILYHPQSRPKRDQLCVSPAEMLTSDYPTSPAASFVIVGSSAVSLDAFDYIIVEDTDCVSEVMNHLIDIFHRYDQWENQLIRAAYQDYSLEKVCNVGSSIFRNTLLVGTRDFQILYISNQMRYRYFQELGSIDQNGYLTSEYSESYTYDEEYLGNSENRDAYILDNGQNLYRELCCNLYTAEQRAGFVFLVEDAHPFTAREHFLLKYLSGYVQHVLEEELFQRQRYNRRITEAMDQALNEPQMKAAALKDILTSEQWTPEESLTCVRLVFDSRESQSLPLSYLCMEIQSIYPGTYVMQRENGIVLLVRSSFYEGTEFRKLFTAYVRDHYGQAGFSNDFHDPELVPAYFRQAEFALQLGQAEHPDFWCYHFRDYAMSYVRAACTAQLPLDTVTAEGFQTLKNYDAKNGAELFHTFCTWLTLNKNTALTARKLFIGRTTLLYRLSRIRELTGLTAETPEEYLYCLLSVYLLDTNGSYY